jgi:transcriptional regulator with GAF, ATPase, and Fis domain
MRKPGRFELAHTGTLFLDEIGDIPAELQPKFLRVLQEQEFERLGATETQQVDVRLVTATNQDLGEMVAAGHFRSDLYYRLNVFPLRIPPLRERREDIPLLALHYAEKYAARMNKSVDGIPARAMELLTRYGWPGNVRELQNVMERAVVFSQGRTLEIDEAWLEPDVPLPGVEREGLSRPEPNRQRRLIESALADSRGRVFGARGAATKLGIPRSTLESQIRSLRINKYAFR